ncbi:MAG: hypothetical protein AAGF48_06155 [Pseudomonadota bacterium]
MSDDDIRFYFDDARVVLPPQQGIALERCESGGLIFTIARDDNLHKPEHWFEVARHSVSVLAQAMLDCAQTGLVVARPEDLKASRGGPSTSSNAERQRRYRERKRNERNAEPVTRDVTRNVTDDVTRNAQHDRNDEMAPRVTLVAAE